MLRDNWKDQDTCARIKGAHERHQERLIHSTQVLGSWSPAIALLMVCRSDPPLLVLFLSKTKHMAGHM